MRPPKDFFRPLAIGAPQPLQDVPFRPSRVIHFLPPHNPKMVGKVPDIAPTVDGLCFGGDYNPEQWPRAVWRDDLDLMRQAGVTLVTVGVFAWAWLEPSPGRYELDRAADVLDRLHEAGIPVGRAWIDSTRSPPSPACMRAPNTGPSAPRASSVTNSYAPALLDGDAAGGGLLDKAAS